MPKSLDGDLQQITCKPFNINVNINAKKRCSLFSINQMAVIKNEIQEYSYESFQSNMNENNHISFHSSINNRSHDHGKARRQLSISPTVEVDEKNNTQKSELQTDQIDRSCEQQQVLLSTKESDKVTPLNIYQLDNLEETIDEFLDANNIQQVYAPTIFQERQQIIKQNLFLKIQDLNLENQLSLKRKKSSIIERRRLNGLNIELDQLDPQVQQHPY